MSPFDLRESSIVDQNQLPSEVELVFEVMPCNALRVAQEPGKAPHPCSYFRKWGTYHSYDYETAEAPPPPSIVQLTQYLGRAPLVPELLSGCRKAPLMAVGINPNLPGWWPATRNSINPLFDDYRQYAHYFRYRESAKLDIPRDQYDRFRAGDSVFVGVGPGAGASSGSARCCRLLSSLTTTKMAAAMTRNWMMVLMKAP